MDFPIRIKKLYPRNFAWLWNRDTRVLLIGLYWIVVGVDFGLKGSVWYKHFFRMCVACGKPLNVNHRLQVVMFHKECRTEGRRILRRAKPVEKEPGFFAKLFGGRKLAT